MEPLLGLGFPGRGHKGPEPLRSSGAIELAKNLLPWEEELDAVLEKFTTPRMCVTVLSQVL